MTHIAKSYIHDLKSNYYKPKKLQIMSENYDVFEKRLRRLGFIKVTPQYDESIQKTLEKKFLEEDNRCFYYRSEEGEFYTSGNISFDEENTSQHVKHDDGYPRFSCVKVHQGNITIYNISRFNIFSLPEKVIGDVTFMDDTSIKRNGSAFKREQDYLCFDYISGSLSFNKSNFVKYLTIFGDKLEEDLVIENYAKIKKLNFEVKTLNGEIYVQDFPVDTSELEVVVISDNVQDGDINYDKTCIPIEDVRIKSKKIVEFV